MNKFERLKEFIQEILPLLKDLGISPILWGSLAYKLYSKDSKMKIKDVDFLISRDNYKALFSILKERKIKYNYVKDWECIQIFKDDLMIEFDPIEKYLINKFQEVDFGSFKLTAISLEDLKRRYKLASESKKVANYSMKKIKEYRIKYEKLKNISSN